jgi:mannose-6-phosphate isomerase-like protein (cupin superfamily)
MEIEYEPLVGTADDAKRVHLHVTTIVRGDDTNDAKHYEHAHTAEEVVYFLEGRATIHLEGKPREVGPGDVAFFPADVVHGPIVAQSDRLKYLVVRSIEDGDEPCCCEGHAEG